MHANKAGLLSAGMRTAKCRGAQNRACQCLDGESHKAPTEGQSCIARTRLTGMMEVLLMMKTCSMAMVGSSASKMRRKAFTSAGSMPCKSNSKSSSVVCPSLTIDETSTLRCRLKSSNDHWLSTPRPRYARAEVTVFVWRSSPNCCQPQRCQRSAKAL